MSGDEAVKKSFYFFHKSLKDILKTPAKPLFNTSGDVSQNETDDDPPSSSKPERSSAASSEYTKKTYMTNLNSWKEYFFFSSNDGRLKDGLKFFKCINSENNQQFTDVRKKLKKSIRHKMLKRRRIAIKRKFHKRNINKFMYKKIK